MTNNGLLFILLAIVSFLGIQAFQIPHVQRYGKSESSPSFSSKLYNAKPSVVSVCTAELCCCQEEGGSALEILENLNSRSLSYPIEEAPCLGACGGGAMVAIDFEDGSAALVSGLEETLAELGLSQLTEEESNEAVPSEVPDTTMENVIEQEDSVNSVQVGSVVVADEPTLNEAEPELVLALEETATIAGNEDDSSYQSESEAAVATMEKPQKVEKPEPELVAAATSRNTPQYQMSSDDVRERMRAEAARDTEQINPWLNMASYLAGKARDKVFGSDE